MKKIVKILPHIKTHNNSKKCRQFIISHNTVREKINYNITSYLNTQNMKFISLNSFFSTGHSKNMPG